MTFFDWIGNKINEACLTGHSNSRLERVLTGQYAVNKQIGSSVNMSTGTPRNQLEEQVEWTLQSRNNLFDKIDLIANQHIATTIKDIIISDCFNDLNEETLMSIRYIDEDGETNKELTNELSRMLKKTKFVEILKDCVTNEGVNYGEHFLSTSCKYGYGIESISDDLDLREHIAVYKNTELLGVFKFDTSDRGRITGRDFISPDKVSHFMLNYNKVPIKITKNFNKKYNIPEKVRVALPLLTPVIDLILQYNQLESLRTAIEINKATQPIVMGVAVSPEQDMTEVSKGLQELSNALNANRNNIINNLDTLDVTSSLQSMQSIMLVPYSQEEGTNSMKQITLNYGESNLSEKLNDLKKSIALAVGVPEQYVSTQTYLGAKDTKEDSLLTNPRYSRMLSKMQDLLKKGIVDLLYKHLRYKYANEEGLLTKKIERDKIEVLFQSTTDLNDRLEDENMLLNAESVGRLVSVADTIASSPNFPLKIKGEQMLQVWKKELYRNPTVSNLFELMTPEEMEEYNNSVGLEDNSQYMDSTLDNDDESSQDDTDGDNSTEDNTSEEDSDDTDNSIRNIFN